ncbi:hypothetical protein [Terriglobus albidus]|uniref:hypothetical protein n=1 Tax=Terriglobus albidus TaxID=1592106 RepID=UPI0021E0F85E|nr:hypothetical protein [Terriglobus albidus]
MRSLVSRTMPISANSKKIGYLPSITSIWCYTNGPVNNARIRQWLGKAPRIGLLLPVAILLFFGLDWRFFAFSITTEDAQLARSKKRGSKDIVQLAELPPTTFALTTEWIADPGLDSGTFRYSVDAIPHRILENNPDSLSYKFLLCKYTLVLYGQDHAILQAVPFSFVQYTDAGKIERLSSNYSARMTRSIYKQLGIGTDFWSVESRCKLE